MQIGRFLALYFTLPVFAAIAGEAPLTAYYESEVRGFYLGHFSRTADLTDEEGKPACTRFNGNLFRGGEPSPVNETEWIEQFVANKIALVVDLRDEEPGDQERAVLVSKNIAYVKLPLTNDGDDQLPQMIVTEAWPGRSVRRTAYERLAATTHVLEIVQEFLRRGRHVYIHCHHGEDRTGLFIKFLRHCPAAEIEFSDHYGGVLYPSIAKHFADLTAAWAKRASGNR